MILLGLTFLIGWVCGYIYMRYRFGQIILYKSEEEILEAVRTAKMDYLLKQVKRKHG